MDRLLTDLNLVQMYQNPSVQFTMLSLKLKPLQNTLHLKRFELSHKNLRRWHFKYNPFNFFIPLAKKVYKILFFLNPQNGSKRPKNRPHVDPMSKRAHFSLILYLSQFL